MVLMNLFFRAGIETQIEQTSGHSSGSKGLDEPREEH